MKQVLSLGSTFPILFNYFNCNLIVFNDLYFQFIYFHIYNVFFVFFLKFIATINKKYINKRSYSKEPTLH